MSETALRRLAERYDILPDYWDIAGKQHLTSDATRVALLAALGIGASDEESAAKRLVEMDERQAERLLDPVTVTTQDAAHLVLGRQRLRAGEVDYALEITLEDGTRRKLAGRTDLQAGGGRVALPSDLPLGYHRLQVEVGGARGSQALFVVPGSCPTPESLLGGKRVFGLCTSLYTLRSRDDLGVGDLGGLRRLLRYCASIGGAFVGVNPLHALLNHGDGISPYRPVSRLFKNVLYLDPRAVPEMETCPQARALLARSAEAGDLARLREARHVDYERVMALRLPVLRMLFEAFARDHLQNETPRGAAYRSWVAAQGEPLQLFGAYLAFSERLGTSSWHRWPAALRDPGSAAARDAASAEGRAIAWHAYLQFELDRQLGEAAREARQCGLPIGVYQDLALGSAPDGCDTWAFPGTFCEGVSLGAPPDPLGELGQDWGLPPMHPRRLREDGYRHFVLLVRAALRHSGALRIDHVMGLYRQFWVPAGRPGSEGAYVRFPADDLFGILALESTRAGALVVGEDLGTVPPEVPVLMRRYGLLSSRILYFEQDPGPVFRAPSSYPERALVTANTHDLPTLEAFLTTGDHQLRRKLGIFRSDEELSSALASRQRERGALFDALAREALSPSPDDNTAIRGAVHTFLCRTPSALVGLSVEDLAGEPDPVNVPGMTLDRYPCWSRRLTVCLEDFESHSDARKAVEGATRERGLPMVPAGSTPATRAS